MIRTIRYNQNMDTVELLEDDGFYGSYSITSLGRWAGYRAFASDDEDYALIVWLVRGTPVEHVARKFEACGMTRVP